MTQRIFATIIWALCLSGLKANAVSWEYREWTTRPTDAGNYTMTANGQIIAGHTLQLGFSGKVCDSPNVLRLSWSTYEKGLQGLLGKDLEISVDLGGESYPLKVRVERIFPFTRLMTIAELRTSILPPALFELMKSSDDVSFNINGPSGLVEKFDVPVEHFSLTGFTANALKVKSACENGVSELEIPPKLTNEEFAQLKIKKFNKTKSSPNKPSNVIDSSSSRSCQRPLSESVAQNLMSSGIQTIASFQEYFLVADSRDGSHPYPPIKMVNACDPTNLKPVVDVPGTAQQVFDMVVSGERLYAISNNHSVLGLYGRGVPDVLLQVIDISDINNVVVLGELEFDGLVPDMAVFDDQIFIADEDTVSQIDASNPRNLRWIKKHKFDIGKYGVEDVAVTQDLIFSIGLKGVHAISQKTGKLVVAQHLPSRPNNVFVDGGKILVELRDKTLIFSLNEDDQSISVVDEISHPNLGPSWYKLENLLVSRYGEAALDLNDTSQIIMPK